MATSIMQQRERAQARDREQVAVHRTGPAADTLGHAAIHQAQAGGCRVCDTVRETRPELFTPAGQATAADLHAWICGRRHKAGSPVARRCEILIDGWREVAARNAASNAVSADDAWALLLNLPGSEPAPAGDGRSLAGWNAVIERSAAMAREPAGIGPGDTVTFPISSTVTGVGTLTVIDGDTAVIERKGKTYRRPAGDVKRSHLRPSTAPAPAPEPAMSAPDAWALLLS